MKKLTKKFSLTFFCTVIVIAVLFFTPAFAWCVKQFSANVAVTANIIDSYFEQGDGTEDRPYVIARPIQMYYFAWLQNLGIFDDDNPASTTGDKRYYFTLGADIDMSENAAYSTLPPIGTKEHPFIGVFDGRYHYDLGEEEDPFDPDNTKEGTYHTISNVTISNTDLSNVPDGGDDGMKYLGLFGVVGSMTDSSVKGEIKNFGLEDVTIESSEPDDDETIIGIVAGYCNGEVSGIGVGSCSISIANGLSPAGLPIGSSSSMQTPETLSFSLIGYSKDSYEAYNVSAIGGGEEFGGSLMMEDLFTRVITARNDTENRVFSQYYTNKTITIDPEGNETVELSGANNYNVTNSGTYYGFVNTEVLDDEDNVIESYGLLMRYSDSDFDLSKVNSQYMYLYGASSVERTQVITTITQTRYDAYAIGDGEGHYLIGSSSGTDSTTTSEDATAWKITEVAGGVTLSIQKADENPCYLYNNNGTLAMSSSNSTTWTIANNKIVNNGYYLIYLDGAWKLWDENTYYSISNGAGTYLNFANNNVTDGNTSTTRWHISSNKIYTYVGTTKTYLYNNNGVLDKTTNAGTATAWTINNNTISNGGYYLIYLDSAWRLREDTYYSIDNGSGTYLNYNNGSLVATNSNSTKWHISGGKIYTYNGNTKTYIYNNNEVLDLTTNSGTATTWTIENNKITSGGYYLMCVDNAWKLYPTTTYYYIHNGSGTYLNYNSGITSGNSQETKWHFVDSKLFTYVNGTKTYLYNNNGTLTTTTTAGTASTWVMGANDIKNGDYYLCFNDGAWKVIKESGYYFINDNNGSYLNYANSTFSVGTAQNATRWYFASSGGGYKVYTYINNTPTYLYNNNGTLTTTTTVGTASVWETANSNFKSGDYYLICDNGGWFVAKEVGYYVIYDSSNNYLNYSNSTFSVGTAQTATKWFMDNNKYYVYVNNTPTYLYNNNGTLTTTTTVGTASTWLTTNGTLKSGDYYLYCPSKWVLTNLTEYYYINDSNDHYLNYSGSEFSAGTSQTATKWFLTNGASGGKIFTYISGTPTYLYNNNGTLTTTTNSSTASTWSISNGQITSGSYYLIYDDEWFVSTTTYVYSISNGNGTYLNLDGSGNVTASTTRTTKWQATSTTSSKIYAKDTNGSTYYLRSYYNALQTTTNSGNGTTWTISTTNGTIVYNNYYLCYRNDAWTLSNVKTHYTIHDNSGHYLNLTEVNSQVLTSVGTSSDATVWEFSNGNSGYISTTLNGTTYYLNFELENMVPGTTASTSWTYNNNTIYCSGGGSTYYMFYDGVCWTIVRNMNSYYLISDGNGHYLSGTYNSSTRAYELQTETNRSYARKWTINTRRISTYINGSQVYLYRSSNSTTELTLSTSRYQWGTVDTTNRKIYSTNSNRYYFLQYANNSWATLGRVNNTNSIVAIGAMQNISSGTRNARRIESSYQPNIIAQLNRVDYNITNSTSSQSLDLSMSEDLTTYNRSANEPYTAYNLVGRTNSDSYNSTAQTSSSNYNLTAQTNNASYDLDNIITNTTTVWNSTSVNNNGTQQITTVPTYIPLTINDDGSVSRRNTGYIVSGSNYYNNSGCQGDIRVSYYGIKDNLYNALGGSSNNKVNYSSARLEVVTRTYKTNGFVRITDSYNSSHSYVNSTMSSNFGTTKTVAECGLTKYNDSRDQLESTLSGSDNVYGLHFMDAQISAERTVNIGKATINHFNYADYPMPQDCIDFNLNQRGYLNFFAGTYFPNNNTFFSLHHIIRDGTVIVSIKEIEKIYGDENDSTKPYIYKYKNEAEPVLPNGYAIMFETSWITAPTMVDYAMYYFEIPVNEGEYALGSVASKNGAYLIYLDIGAASIGTGSNVGLESAIKGIDFVVAGALSSENIATTLNAITSETSSCAVIVLKNRYQGTITFVRENYVDNGTPKVRITYTLSQDVLSDYIKTTSESEDVVFVRVVASS